MKYIIYILMLVVLIVSVQASIMTHFPFNGTLIDSQNGLKLNPSDSTNYVSGVRGQSLQCSSGYFYNDSLIDYNTIKSVCLWINPNQSLSGLPAWVMSVTPDPNIDITLFAYSFFDETWIRARLIQDPMINNHDYVTATNADVEEWHHLCYVDENNGNASIYYNGSLVGNKQEVLTFNDFGAYLMVCREKYTSSDPFKGEIDELYLFNHSLTAQEAHEIYLGNYSELLPPEWVNITSPPNETNYIGNTSTTIFYDTSLETVTNCSFFHNATGSYTLNDSRLGSTCGNVSVEHRSGQMATDFYNYMLEWTYSTAMPNTSYSLIGQPGDDSDHIWACRTSKGVSNVNCITIDDTGGFEDVTTVGTGLAVQYGSFKGSGITIMSQGETSLSGNGDVIEFPTVWDNTSFSIIASLPTDDDQPAPGFQSINTTHAILYLEDDSGNVEAVNNMDWIAVSHGNYNINGVKISAGNFTQSGGSATVTIGQTMDSTSYFVGVTQRDTSVNTEICSCELNSAGRSTTQFTVYCGDQTGNYANCDNDQFNFIVWEYNEGNLTLTDDSCVETNPTTGNFTFDFINNTQETVSYYVDCDGTQSSIYEFSYNTDIYPPVVTIDYPTFNLTMNDTVWLNFTSSEVATCTYNLTNMTEHFNNGTLFSYEEDLMDNGYYNVFVECTDSGGNSGNATTNFEKDNIMPSINWYFPSELSTSEAILNVTEKLVVSGSDVNLFAYECLIRDDNHELKYNFTQENLPTSSYLVQENFVPDRLGEWYVTCTFSDSHTEKEWDIDNKVKTIKKEKDLIFIIPEKDKSYKKHNVSIYYKGKHGINNIETEKKFDRTVFKYKFNYDKKEDIYTHKFRVTCSNSFYIPSSQYPGHFVCYDSATWVDFSSVNLQSIDVTECGKDCWDIELTSDENDTLIFESIGGLNFNTETVYFDVVEEYGIGIDRLQLGIGCPDNIADVLVLMLLTAIIACLYLVCKFFVKFPVITIVLGLIPAVFLGMAIVSCSALLGGMIVALSFVLMVTEWFL